MAWELLKGARNTHLYRHDVESLLYIMLLLGARHTIVPAKDDSDKSGVVMREGALPYQGWFCTQNYELLGSAKHSFLTDDDNEPAVELSPVFEDFRPWLDGLRANFSDDFADRASHKKNQRRLLSQKREPGGVAPTPTPFDDETLGGHVDHSTIVGLTQGLKGQLEGLIVRYRCTLPTPTAVEAEARVGS